MKTLNSRLENAIKSQRGLIKQSLIELSINGFTSTGKNQNRKNQVWTAQVCEILQKNNIPFKAGNNAPRKGVTGEFVELTSKVQLAKIEADKKLLEKEKNEKILIRKTETAQAIADIKLFIAQNKALIDEKKAELNVLKSLGNKEDWQAKANALVQMVCKNNFKSVTWSDVYTMIKHL